MNDKFQSALSGPQLQLFRSCFWRSSAVQEWRAWSAMGCMTWLCINSWHLCSSGGRQPSSFFEGNQYLLFVWLSACFPLSPRLRLFPFEWGSPGLTDLSLLQHLHNSFATLDAIHSVFSKLAQSFSIWVLAAEKIVLVKSNISKHLQTKSVPLKQKTKQWISLLCPH